MSAPYSSLSRQGHKTAKIELDMCIVAKNIV
jgi:hypothetical protein